MKYLKIFQINLDENIDFARAVGKRVEGRVRRIAKDGCQADDLDSYTRGGGGERGGGDIYI